eukprot:2931919-Lingulodinium_polyedra.AAC.1
MAGRPLNILLGFVGGPFVDVGPCGSCVWSNVHASAGVGSMVRLIVVCGQASTPVPALDGLPGR